MKLLSASEPDLIVAAQALREGKLVAFPTETVYGLGANAFDERAVARVFEAKARPTFDPLIVHIARLEDILILAEEVPENAWTLARCLWPGPLTIILPKRREVPDIVTAGLSTVAVRFPSHPVARRIIELAKIPIAAPSANPFGYLSPTTAEHVIDMLGERIDYLVDGGPCDVGLESTVIDMTGERPALLRPGGMPLERIEELIGLVDIPVHVDIPGHGEPSADEGLEQAGEKDRLRSELGFKDAETQGMAHSLKSREKKHNHLKEGLESSSQKGPSFESPSFKGPSFKSPGQSSSHYAPSTPLFLFDKGSLPEAAELKGILHPCIALAFDGRRARILRGSGLFDGVQVLSEEGDLREAAARLFSLLHDLDEAGLAAIYAERVPDAGLGRAINDRLYRASRKERIQG